MSSSSIHTRLLIAASVVLALFLGLGGVALNQAFLNSLEESTEARLMGHVYALLGAAETDDSGRMRFPEALPDPRFGRLNSGLYAEVRGDQDAYHWRSHSLTGRTLPKIQEQATGQSLFTKAKFNVESYYLLSYSLIWEDDEGLELTYHINIGEEEQRVQVQAEVFRERLWFWLGGAAALLLFAQGGVLAWGLRPLRQVSQDLDQVEDGGKAQLTGRYPKELKGLTESINSLIQHNTDSRDRYRNSLGDLAHSLKTPLAVLQGVRDGTLDDVKEALDEQIPRMDDIVQYQLKRAAADGQSMGTVVVVADVIRRLVSTLEKVYQAKSVICHLNLDDTAQFQGDEGDLMELLGNILENAFKYGKKQVWVTLGLDPTSSADLKLRVTIEDDGDGIEPEVSDQILVRGVRGDQSAPGQGIGLSIARDIIDLYKGALLIKASTHGGVAMGIILPSRRG